MTAIEARFASKCGACDRWINEGDRIVPDPLDHGGLSWVHEKCPVASADLERSVCPECWLEPSVSGECGCTS